MLNRAWVCGWVMGGMLWASQAHAQCTKDTDCKGDRVCEAGQCTDPAPLPPPPTPPPAAPAAPPAAVAAPGAPPPAAAPVAAAPPTAAAAAAPPAVFAEPEPKYHRRTGMLTAGIIMTAAAPVVLVAGTLISANDYDDCNANVSAIAASGSTSTSLVNAAYSKCRDDQQTRGYLILGTSAVLAGVGIPLIIIGAKRVPDEPAPQAQLTPWFSPNAAGLALRGTL